MKSRRWILLSLTSLVAAASLTQFSGCSKSEENTAQAPPPAPAVPPAPSVPAAGASPTAANISSHLEYGGEFFAVLDVKGEVEKIGNLVADYATEMIKQVPETNLPPNLDFHELIQRLGLYNIDGVGLSSWQDSDGLHHNRAFLYTPKGRIGLLKIFGDKPAPFVIPSLAPADADLAFESTMDIKSVFDLVLSYVKDVGGPAAARQITSELAMPIPGTTLTVQNLVDHLNTKVFVIVRADPKQILQASPEFKMPMTDFVIAFDGFSDVLNQLDPMFKDNPMFTVTEKDGLKTVTLEMPAPDPFTVYKPELIADSKTKRLYLVSRASFANETVLGQGPRLSSSPDFKTAIAGLPTEGNSLSYISKKGAATFVEYYDRQVLAAVSPNLTDKLIDFGGLDKLPHGLASTQVNLPDGIMVQGTSTSSAKDAIFLVPVVGVGLMSAMAIPAFSKVRAESREKAITNNLRQISTAGQQYMLDHGVTQVTYQQLITGPSPVIRPVMTVEGESYDDIVIRQGTTRISVTTPDGQVITFDL